VCVVVVVVGCMEKGTYGSTDVHVFMTATVLSLPPFWFWVVGIGGSKSGS
jgi:hypothetical protein